MMQMIIMWMMTLNAFLFTQTNHPMTMGLILLIQTLMTCLLTGSLTKSFWFSYILFLIFIGGMLILFIYMSSLASNEKIKFSTLFLLKLGVLLSFFMLMMNFMDKFYTMNMFNNLEFNKMNNMNTTMMNENLLSLSKMYDKPNMMIIILLINYLLLTLIIIVKITSSYSGPLRPKYF